MCTGGNNNISNLCSLTDVEVRRYRTILEYNLKDIHQLPIPEFAIQSITNP